MRRMFALVLAVGLLGIAPVAAVSAAECPKLIGSAVLYVDTEANSGAGTAVVRLGGVTEIVTFDSEAIGDGPDGTLLVEQDWNFAAGTVTFLEYAQPMAVGGHYLSINSDVEATAGGSGDLSYHGLYDLNTTTATFLVNGRLCIG